ncbi:hypothetical protein [Halobacillus sp. BBL2006]|uniref:hypothetical protein n=1 Tax=Halobacillus sp. BBL2006 TaxID=1543706 RepID=UPI0005422EEF|nr:hypothetical protein [Halobacillus sp. BBL2006]KHE72645.1 hypothetical protein LD39_03510 [Halobacillus sp. BBL2006]
MLRKEWYSFKLDNEPLWFEIMKADQYIVMTDINGWSLKVEAIEKGEAIQSMIELINQEHPTG